MAFTIPGVVNDLEPTVTGFVTSLPSDRDGAYTGGLLVFTTGACCNEASPVIAYNAQAHKVALAPEDPLSQPPQPGDSFLIIPGVGELFKSKVKSQPPAAPGMRRVVNLYVNDQGKLVVEYEEQ